MRDLVKILPVPDNKKKIVKRFQNVNDIIDLILIGDKQNKIYSQILYKYFNTGDHLADLRTCFDYAKRSIEYVAEGSSQTVKTVPAILNYGYGDCKHYSLFMASCCRSLNIPYIFRFAGYNKYKDEASHVYVVCKVYGKVLPLDAVLGVFGAEKPYHFKIDVKPLK